MKTNMQPPTANAEHSTKAEPQRVPASYREWIHIGDMRLARMEKGTLWMMNRIGEGMEISDEKKLAKLLEKFFRREF